MSRSDGGLPLSEAEEKLDCVKQQLLPETKIQKGSSLDIMLLTEHLPFKEGIPGQQNFIEQWAGATDLSSNTTETPGFLFRNLPTKASS